MAASAPPSLYLRVHPAVGGHLARLFVPEDVLQHAAKHVAPSAAITAAVPFFVVLDRSGSMGANVGRLVQKVLPSLLTSIRHPASEPVTLLAFDDRVEVVQQTAAQLKVNQLKARGGTNLAPAIRMLQQIISAMPKVKGQPLRILTLTDGELSDQAQSLHCAGELRAELSARGFVVNSQAVRIFTSSSQPDTRGLTGMMQLSNGAQSQLLDLDVYKQLDAMADIMATTFAHDKLTQLSALRASQPILLAAPWQKGGPTSTVTLAPGENIFWMSQLPAADANGAAAAAAAAACGAAAVQFTIEGSACGVMVEMCPALDADNYQELLAAKISACTQQIRLLKVLGTPDARDEIAAMVDYWSKLDTSLAVPAEQTAQLLAAKAGLAARLQYFRATVAAAARGAAVRMAELANNDRIAQLNSAQAADFLRSVDGAGAAGGSRAAKGLARRAIQSEGGLSFDECARAEVRAMAAHLHELDGINDDEHAVSFYSQCTTLGGIKATAALVNGDLIDSLSAADVLQMINLVGCAAQASVGDYPDPMSFHINRMFSGCHISLSDLLTTLVLQRGRGDDDENPQLEVPGQPGEAINNVVVFFDDDRIAQFMRTHAPKLLEYSASVGMRRVLAEVPLTHAYTLVSGAWRLAQEIARGDAVHGDRSELQLSTFVKLARGYQQAVGKYFAHVYAALVREQPGRAEQPQRSFSLAKNGVTNCFEPLMFMAQHQSADRYAELMPPILRALFSFECWQAVRKCFRHQAESRAIIAQHLSQLLRIDLDAHATEMTPLFAEPEANPQHYDGFTLNDALVDQLWAKCRHVERVVCLPQLLQVAGASAEAMPVHKAVATLQATLPAAGDKAAARAALGLPADEAAYPLRLFRALNVAHAFLHPLPSDRFLDELDGPPPTFHDLLDRAAAEDELKAYVRARFEERYQTDLQAKALQEKTALLTEFIDALFASPSLDESVRLLREGTSRGPVRLQLVNVSSFGFGEVRDALLDLGRAMPGARRAEMIGLLLLARDPRNKDEETNVIWNNGNVLMLPSLEPFRLVFLASLAPDAADQRAQVRATNAWAQLAEQYKARALHRYREGLPNSSGHSNDKPSFWAMGYQTLAHFAEAVEPEQWEIYRQLHHNCCGIRNLGAFLTPQAARAALPADMQLNSKARRRQIKQIKWLARKKGADPAAAAAAAAGKPKPSQQMAAAAAAAAP